MVSNLTRYSTAL